MNQDATTGQHQASKRPPATKRVGVVDSICGQKTVRIVLNRLVKHRLYGRYMRRRTRLLAHDPAGQEAVGDTVEITQCRPISKHKSWRLVRVVKRSTQA